MSETDRLSNEELLETALRYDPVGYRLALDIEHAHFHDLYLRAPTELRTELGLVMETHGESVLFAAPGVPHVLFNRVERLGANGRVSPAEVDAILQSFAEKGVDKFLLQVEPAAANADTRAELATRGLVPFRRPWVKLLRGSQPAKVVECEFEIAEIGPAHAELFASMMTEVFGLPEAAGKPYAAAVGRAGHHFYLARAAGQPAAAATLFVQGNVGYFGGAVTLPGFRRRSAQRALMQRRIGDALSLGCTALATETGLPLVDEANPSYRNMLHMGFSAVGTRQNYTLEGTTW